MLDTSLPNEEIAARSTASGHSVAPERAPEPGQSQGPPLQHLLHENQPKKNSVTQDKAVTAIIPPMPKSDPGRVSPRHDSPTDVQEDEIEEELIIEDFTIDGICGVY